MYLDTAAGTAAGPRLLGVALLPLEVAPVGTWSADVRTNEVRTLPLVSPGGRTVGCIAVSARVVPMEGGGQRERAAQVGSCRATSQC